MKKIFLLLLILFMSSLQPALAVINVAFTIDNNYPIPTLLAINSIIQNSNSKYVFWIIENDITPKNKALMKEFVDKRQHLIKFVHIDRKYINCGTELFKFSNNRITPIAIARIALPNLIPQDVHRVIYMDGDMLSTVDLKLLYNINLGNYSTAMVENNYPINYQNYKFKDAYYNSGLIVMDLDKWREQNISDKMFNYLEKNIDKFTFDSKRCDTRRWNCYLYPDQDLINIVLDGKIKKLPDIWNNQVIHSKYMITRGGIYHYLGPDKPWTFPAHDNLAYYVYSAYWQSSELKKYKFYYFLKSILFRLNILCRLKKQRYLEFISKKKRIN